MSMADLDNLEFGDLFEGIGSTFGVDPAADISGSGLSKLGLQPFPIPLPVSSLDLGFGGSDFYHDFEPTPNFALSGSDSADYSVLSKASSTDSEKLSVVSPPRPAKIAVNPLQKRPKKRASISRDQIQRLESQGKTIREACRALDVSKSELFRIRKKFGMPRWVRNRSARIAKQAGVAAARSAATAAAAAAASTRPCRTSTSTTETISTNEDPSAPDDISFGPFDSTFALSKDQLMLPDTDLDYTCSFSVHANSLGHQPCL